MIRRAGSIDGCHIPVMPPTLHHTDFYNRKGWYSMLMQAFVNHNCQFTDLCVGWPGSVHDARVLANSSMYKKASQKNILCGRDVNISGTDVTIFLVGDSAYPLSPWLMKHTCATENEACIY